MSAVAGAGAGAVTGPKRVAERSLATFLVGLLAFSPPLLTIFGAEAFVFGLPLLYFYLFTAWAVLIAVVAWIADIGAGPPPGRAGSQLPGGPGTG